MRRTKDYYPFDKYKIPSEKTAKRALSEKDFLKIKNATNIGDIRLNRARDTFMISYLLYGASFMDLALLKVGNIKNERVAYRRRKNGRLYNIKITEPLKILLQPLLENKNNEEYIFPYSKEYNSEIALYNRIKNCMKRYNKDLKRLAEYLGISSENLTSYCSRHTFATMARNKDISVSIISQMMGHQNVGITEIYLKSIENKVLDNAMERLLE